MISWLYGELLPIAHYDLKEHFLPHCMSALHVDNQKVLVLTI